MAGTLGATLPTPRRVNSSRHERGRGRKRSRHGVAKKKKNVTRAATKRRKRRLLEALSATPRTPGWGLGAIDPGPERLALLAPLTPPPSHRDGHRKSDWDSWRSVAAIVAAPRVRGFPRGPRGAQASSNGLMQDRGAARKRAASREVPRGSQGGRQGAAVRASRRIARAPAGLPSCSGTSKES